MKNKILTIKEELYLDLAIFLINHSSESEVENKIQILTYSPIYISIIEESNVISSFTRVRNNFLKEDFIDDVKEKFNQLSITKSEKTELFKELFMLYLWNDNNLSDAEKMVIGLYQHILEIDQSELEKINEDSIDEIIIRKELVKDLGLDKKGCFTSVLMFVFIAVLIYI